MLANYCIILLIKYKDLPCNSKVIWLEKTEDVEVSMKHSIWEPFTISVMLIITISERLNVGGLFINWTNWFIELEEFSSNDPLASHIGLPSIEWWHTKPWSSPRYLIRIPLGSKYKGSAKSINYISILLF